MDAYTSSQLGNKYILLDLIGVGGMAEVYRCKLLGEKGFEKIIVLKKLLEQAAKDRETTTNFIDEAKLTALLQHENIAHIYDFGEIDGSYYIAMEYLFGKDLHSLVQRSKELGNCVNTEAALTVISQICSGMHYAHTLKDLNQKPLNIIHRDLSPHNIFITYEGKVKIIDFGVAKAELYDHRTQVGVIKGKITYMSPEQLTDEKIDQRSDIYTIGILLYEMLSGKKMYEGDTAALIRKCMQGKYEKIEKIRKDIPDEVRDILYKALSFDRIKRFDSCDQMREEIEKYLFSRIQQSPADYLKSYMAELFEDDFESEKAQLYSTTKKFDKIYTTAEDEKTEIRSYSNGPHSGAVFIDAANTLTIVDDSFNQTATAARNGFISRFLGNPYGKSVFFLLLLVVTTLILQITLNREEAVLSVSEVNSSSPIQIKQREDSYAFSENGGGSEKEQKPPKTDQQYVSRQVEQLLQQAQFALIEPVSILKLEEAAQHYYHIQNLAPEHIEVQNGLQVVEEKFAQLAEQDLGHNKIVEADITMRKALEYVPDSTRLLAIKNLIDQEKGRVIEQLFWKAKTAMHRNDLTTPKNNCAYKFYKDILAFDRKHKEAWRGMYAIADRYAEFAEKSFRKLNLGKASEYVDKGLRVIPEHKKLLEVKDDLSRSKPRIFYRFLQKNYDYIVQSDI